MLSDHGELSEGITAIVLVRERECSPSVLGPANSGAYFGLQCSLPRTEVCGLFFFFLFSFLSTEPCISEKVNAQLDGFLSFMESCF